MVSGIIQQAIEIMFIVLDRCCEKKIVDLFRHVKWLVRV